MNPVLSFFFSLFFFYKKEKPTSNDHILLTMIHTYDPICAYDCKEWYPHTTKQARSVKLLDHSSDISGYHADFHEGHDTVGGGQGHSMACVN